MPRRPLSLAALLLAAPLHALHALHAQHAQLPAWAFPMAPAAPAAYDSLTPRTVPGSRAHYTEADILGRLVVPDWHPDDHPPMPSSVARGRPPVVPGCAYCHLPNGLGRPENATITALPAAYIVQQIADMRSGARRAAWTTPAPWGASMIRVAQNATDAEVAEAAAYFAALPPRTHMQVVEAARVPVTRVAGILYAVVPGGGTEPLGTRLVEVARDLGRHEQHDDLLGYVAYVPPGSISRGARLATRGAAGFTTACVTCHGPGLHGLGAAPPLAGRSPSYLLRQLLAFQAGTRDTPAGQPMRAIVAGMTVDDMIAAVAYAASRTP